MQDSSAPLQNNLVLSQTKRLSVQFRTECFPTREPRKGGARREQRKALARKVLLEVPRPKVTSQCTFFPSLPDLHLP